MILAEYKDIISKYQIESKNISVKIIPNINSDNPNAIRQIEEWTEPEKYVYDLTTSNHHFHAGV